jgi:hypothetical protein
VLVTKKNVSFSTEVESVDEVTNAIKKVFLFRCEDHIDTDVDEMLVLRRKKFASSDDNMPTR